MILGVGRVSFPENPSHDSGQKKTQQALAVRVLDRLVAGADEDAFEIGMGGVNARGGGGDSVAKRSGPIVSVRKLTRHRP